MNRFPKLSEHHKQNRLLIAVSHIHARLSRKDLQATLPCRTSSFLWQGKGEERPYLDAQLFSLRLQPGVIFTCKLDRYNLIALRNHKCETSWNCTS